MTAGPETALSTSDRRTFEALHRHPVAHNLDWSAVVGLLGRLGTVEHKPNNEWSIRIGGGHLVLRRPHAKDLTPDEVTQVRRFLDQVGAPSSPVGGEAPASGPDLLVAIDHHEARLYQLDLRTHDPARQTIRPHDPHHFRHHLTHKDQPRQRGQRASEDPSFYERIAEALAGAVPHGRILVVGHGTGHSEASHNLIDWLRRHHSETGQRVAGEVVADLSSLTAAQLLDLGREALRRPGVPDRPAIS